LSFEIGDDTPNAADCNCQKKMAIISARRVITSAHEPSALENSAAFR